MDLSNLQPAKGSTHSRKRVGRGEGSGHGGTSTRGHKGAQSRSGYSRKIGFEGGQMPLQRRVPKFGFTNPNRVEYKGLNLDTLQALVEAKKLTTTITVADLVNKVAFGFAIYGAASSGIEERRKKEMEEAEKLRPVTLIRS